MKTNNSPFQNKIKGVSDITWVKPQLVAEVEFTEWTSDNNIRHPSFKGMRLDKSPQKIIKEIAKPVEDLVTKKSITKSVKSSSFTISNPNKILFPEDDITKLQITQYYQTVHSWILPYIKNRNLSLLRCPEGYNKCFFQKHLNEVKIKDLYTHKMKRKKEIEEGI